MIDAEGDHAFAELEALPEANASTANNTNDAGQQAEAVDTGLAVPQTLLAGTSIVLLCCCGCY